LAEVGFASDFPLNDHQSLTDYAKAALHHRTS
jgi:hypothetical protein